MVSGYRIKGSGIVKDINGKLRAVIENVSPCIEGGLFPARRVQGETVIVEADIFTDGHDALAAALMVRSSGSEEWGRFPMRHLVNDRWRGMFAVSDIGSYFFTVTAGIDRFATLAADFIKKFEVGEASEVDAALISDELRSAAARAGGRDDGTIERFQARLTGAPDMKAFRDILLEKSLGPVMAEYADRENFTTWPHSPLEVIVERGKARFSTWYEFFPRSTCGGGMGGSLKKACERLPEIARMGFDVVYLPPVHPIGRTDRKGPNNTLPAGPDDPGSPWAIGSELGGHMAVEPGLGTADDLRRFIKTADTLGLEVAMDLAFQCSPDHPYIKQHPEWFRHRPDGTIQYAENPPKKYQDIVPFNFETEDWKGLWKELKNVALFWIEHGVRIFRVDNPHTKPMAFWQWLIADIRREYPDVIFLAEAFTRPKVMRRLARSGFAQSYTYFTWRNSKKELADYMEELTGTELAEYFQPHFWPNTPDILPEFLQIGGLPAFRIRLVLAATLSSSYGIYGPAFELAVHDALPGREEYLDSEKYEIHDWNWDEKGNLRDLIARVNMIRRENPALQVTRNIRFLETDNDKVLFFSKESADGENLVIVGVSHDPFAFQECSVTLPLDEFGIGPEQPYLLHDLLGDEKFIWQGARNTMGFDPNVLPARIFRVRRRMRHEQDFDYFI